MKLFYLFKIACCLTLVDGEEYNLFGDPGQAYSLDIYMGQPKQKLRVIVDTGSTTLAIATYPRRKNDDDEYFHIDNSSTLVDTGKVVEAKYSQGRWLGHYVTDFIEFPSLKNVPKVRSDFAIITQSYKFFVNGSGWQGLLGLAYLPIGSWGVHAQVGSWLDSLESHIEKNVSFELELCGVLSSTNSTHYGKFSIIVDGDNHTSLYRTPVLRKRWYEIGVLAFKVSYPDSKINKSRTIYETLIANRHVDENCEDTFTPKRKSIVDSGTTNIKLPNEVFKEVTHKIMEESQKLNMLILNEFWDSGEAACWPEPQVWQALPQIEIDILSDIADNQYFTLIIPPQNYMRVMTAKNSSGEGGSVSQYCYKLGLESGGIDTVLGYTAMEGLKVFFNRSGGWLGFDTSECGPKAHITGPHTAPYFFRDPCKITSSQPEVAVSIQAAQWVLCAVSVIAAIVLIYLLAPAFKMCILRRRQNTAHSVSQDALVDQELS